MQHCFRVKTHSLSLGIFIGVGQPNKAKKVARLNLTSTYLLKHSYKELQIPQIKIQSKYFTPKARWVTPKPRSQWSVLRSKLLRFRLWNELAYCVQRTYVNATLESFTKHGNLINSFLHLPSNSFNSVAICCCCHQCDQIGLLLKHIGKKSCYKCSPNVRSWSSVTRLGHFWNILARKAVTKVAQIFWNGLSYFGNVTAVATFLGNYWKIVGYFLLQHLVTLAATTFGLKAAAAKCFYIQLFCI